MRYAWDCLPSSPSYPTLQHKPENVKNIVLHLCAPPPPLFTFIKGWGMSWPLAGTASVDRELPAAIAWCSAVPWFERLCAHIAQHRPASPSIAQHRPASPSIAQHRPASPSIAQQVHDARHESRIGVRCLTRVVGDMHGHVPIYDKFFLDCFSGPIYHPSRQSAGERESARMSLRGSEAKGPAACNKIGQ